jgi:hypothetical protein
MAGSNAAEPPMLVGSTELSHTSARAWGTSCPLSTKFTLLVVRLERAGCTADQMAATAGLEPTMCTPAHISG